jgi:imidazolonepropionase
MLVEEGQIRFVGTSEEVRSRVTTHRIIDVAGRVVTPGLIDAHTHPVFGGSRANEFEMRAQGKSYQEIAAAGGGIRASVRATRAASEEALFASAKLRAKWFLSNGTTTIEAKSGYGLTLEDELKMLKVIRRLDAETPLSCVPTFLGAHAFPDDIERSAYIHRLVHEMLPAAKGLASFCDIFCEERYFTADEARHVLGHAKRRGFGLRMHVDQLTNGGGARLAAELGALTADHLEKTDVAGIEALKQGGVMPVLLPGSVYALGLSKYPDARRMIDAGLPVVLASDFNPGSSPVASLPFVMNLACTQMRLTPAESLVACTVNAARSLNLSDRGSLEVGKRADFVVWDAGDYREIAYWIGAPLVNSVFVAGRCVA